MTRIGSVAVCLAGLLCVAVLGLSTGCLRSSHSTFAVAGRVVDAAGKPVRGVAVTTAGPAYPQTVLTDGRGCFLIYEYTSSDKHAMPFSVDANGSKSFRGTLASPDAVRVRVVLADASSDKDTAVDVSPAPGALQPCEPPRASFWSRASFEQATTATPIATLRELPAHVGEYPCRNGLLKSPVLESALQDVLDAAYERYSQHIELSACDVVTQRGSWIFLDLYKWARQEGFILFILVNPQTSQVYVSWIPWVTLSSPVRDGWESRTYGPSPVPREVSTIIVDELTSNWGHVATFSWRDGVVQVRPR